MKGVDPHASMTVNSKEAFKVVMGMFASHDVQDNFPLEAVNFERQYANDSGQFRSYRWLDVTGLVTDFSIGCRATQKLLHATYFCLSIYLEALTDS